MKKARFAYDLEVGDILPKVGEVIAVDVIEDPHDIPSLLFTFKSDLGPVTRKVKFDTAIREVIWAPER